MTGLASLLAGLGVVAVGFGLLLALLALAQGLADPLWVVGNLVVGVALLVAAAVMSLDSLTERMRSTGGRRAGTYGASAVVGTALGLLILGLLGFLSVRYTHRIDVSEAKVHTLSQQTRELLAGLEQDVTITAFFNESEAPPIRDLFERYAYENERVDVRFLDPNAVPALVEELGLTTDELARGLARVELASGEATNLTEFSEPEITNALQKLVRSTGKKVYFLTGHNERRIEAEEGAETPWAGSPDSFGMAAGALENETYAVEPLLLAARGEVPDDASVVVVGGPTRPLLPAELEALGRYLERGGALFVAVDPRARTNLYELLGSWGVRLGDDVVVDRALAIFGQATTPLAGEYDGTHPITELMRDPTMFPMVRSVEIDPAAQADYAVIVKTGRESWAERDLEGWRSSGRAEYDAGDLLGPVPIAVAGTPSGASRSEDGEASEAGGRVVVFGDSDFATNEFFDAGRNRDLFVNSVNWLAGDVEQITVRPNVSRASSFQMTQDEFRTIQTLSLFVLPEAIAVLGVVTWWRRRRLE